MRCWRRCWPWRSASAGWRGWHWHWVWLPGRKAELEEPNLAHIPMVLPSRLLCPGRCCAGIAGNVAGLRTAAAQLAGAACETALALQHILLHAASIAGFYGALHASMHQAGMMSAHAEASAAGSRTCALAAVAAAVLLGLPHSMQQCSGSGRSAGSSRGVSWLPRAILQAAQRARRGDGGTWVASKRWAAGWARVAGGRAWGSGAAPSPWHAAAALAKQAGRRMWRYGSMLLGDPAAAWYGGQAASSPWGLARWACAGAAAGEACCLAGALRCRRLRQPPCVPCMHDALLCL